MTAVFISICLNNTHQMETVFDSDIKIKVTAQYALFPVQREYRILLIGRSLASSMISGMVVSAVCYQCETRFDP